MAQPLHCAHIPICPRRWVSWFGFAPAQLETRAGGGGAARSALVQVRAPLLVCVEQFLAPAK